jgi:hypothetical protein
MVKPVSVPPVLVTELLASRAAKDDDVWLLGWSGNTTLLLAAEQGVDLRAFPVRADGEISQRKGQ